jgi:hypothetical protein
LCEADCTDYCELGGVGIELCFVNYQHEA